MVQIGELSVRVLFGVAILGFVMAVLGLVTRRRRNTESARRLMYLSFVLHLLAIAGLATAFLTDQFQFRYVAENSSRAMTSIYKVSAIWGGMEGSLLLWGFVLSIYGALFAYSIRDDWRWSFSGGALMALFLVQIFFLVLLNVASFPFARFPGGAPADGAGLNPLLQNPGMAIHPPLLYAGFVGLTIPFSLSIGALLSGRINDYWIDSARAWSLVAWTILGLGIMRGGLWAYQELGWGGYWAWDPVENASFMPWLLATAFIHSIMIQKHRGMLKVWNVFLAILAFGFTILGTFLTRSGLITSVHTFARNQTLGVTFLSFLGLVFLGGLGLIAWRWKSLRSKHTLESFLSREFMFILNNLLLVGLTFVIFWGTMFPTFSELFTGDRQSVGPPYFNMVTIPLFLLLILTTGVGSLIGWRKAGWRNLKRNFTIPLIGLVVTFIPSWFVVKEYAWALHQLPTAWDRQLSYVYCALAYSISVFTALTMIQEYVRGAASRVRRFGENIATAIVRLFQKNRQRYGGYLAHIGFLIVVVGIATSSSFGRERVASLSQGNTIEFAGYEITYEGLDQFPIIPQGRDRALARAWQANLKYRYGGKTHYLMPQKRVYRRSEQPMTEVARDIRPAGDLYVVLSGLPQNQNGLAVLKFWYNPLVSLVWAGVLVVALGALLALIPIPGLTAPADSTSDSGTS